MSAKGKPQSIDDPSRGLRGLADNITDPQDKLTTECTAVLIWQHCGLQGYIGRREHSGR
jgi:hypothetical protein